MRFSRLSSIVVAVYLLVASAAFGLVDQIHASPIANQTFAQAQSNSAPPAAQAQPSSTPPAAVSEPVPPEGAAAPATTEGVPAVVIDAQSLESVLGQKVRSDTGDDMGRIVDILVDKSGQTRAAIIDFGGFIGVGSRQIAVDWKALHFPSDPKSGAVTVQLTRDQLRGAPIYKPGEQVVVLGQVASASMPMPSAKASPAAAVSSPATEGTPDPSASKSAAPK